MRGFQGVYNLAKRVRTQLFSIESDPCPVLSTSEVPTSRSFRSLLAKARITCIILLWLQRIENERTQSLNAAIAGARAAATQFSKKGQSKSATKYEINPCLKSDVQNLPSTSESKNNRVQEVDTKGQFGLPDGRLQRGNWYKYVERKSLSGDEANIIENNRSRNGDFNQKSGAPSKVADKKTSWTALNPGRRFVACEDRGLAFALLLRCPLSSLPSFLYHCPSSFTLFLRRPLSSSPSFFDRRPSSFVLLLRRLPSSSPSFFIAILLCSQSFFVALLRSPQSNFPYENP
ncbi:hypothetical protein MRB53_001257 [Persea americana]|uniref:Uncharacterized protein n=1 Tax=Persea americana TaxID=3435 RepID=A0ACC2MR67_PERAE|nr:hypothetical protein MRB53_001257 [Persea americana]